MWGSLKSVDIISSETLVDWRWVLSFTRNKIYGFSYGLFKNFSLGQVKVNFKDSDCFKHFLCSYLHLQFKK